MTTANIGGQNLSADYFPGHAVRNSGRVGRLCVCVWFGGVEGGREEGDVKGDGRRVTD